MEFDDYQRKALVSDLNPNQDGLVISLLGLAGEAGGLLTEYKKFLRDGPSHRMFQERIVEELGDILWYVSSIATKFDIPLSRVASENLSKIQDRWGERIGNLPTVNIISYDSNFPENERFPSSFVARIEQVNTHDTSKVRVVVNGRQMGSHLSDNSYDNDGYRFHDVFHLACVAILGWSPVVRKLLDCKRKSNPQVDEVEDGGRAAAIEEGISALVFAYAKDHDFFNGVKEVDYHLLKTIKDLTQHLEVKDCTLGEWERAILDGYSIWRELVKQQHGDIQVDLVGKSIALL